MLLLLDSVKILHNIIARSTISGEAKGPACPAGQDHKFPRTTIFNILKIDSLYDLRILIWKLFLHLAEDETSSFQNALIN